MCRSDTHVLRSDTHVLCRSDTHVLLTLAEKSGIDLNGIPAEFIKEGVHARLDILVKGALDVYEQVYPQAEKIVRRVLSRAPSHFDARMLDALIKEVSKLRAKSGLSTEDVIRLLLECGAVGIEGDLHEFSSTGKFLMEVLFEYQVKGVLVPSNRTRLAIHPMLYQEVQSDVDMSRIAYPLPGEDEEQELLSELGIRLG